MPKQGSARRAASPAKEASPKCFLWLIKCCVPSSPRTSRFGPACPQGPGRGVPSPRELLPWLYLCPGTPEPTSLRLPRRGRGGRTAHPKGCFCLQPTSPDPQGGWRLLGRHLGSPQALRQGWAERAELVPTPLLSRLGNTTGLPNLAIPTRISSRCTILDGSQIPLSRCGNSLPC